MHVHACVGGLASMYMCLSVHACVCVCVRVCVRPCVRVCVCVRTPTSPPSSCHHLTHERHGCLLPRQMVHFLTMVLGGEGYLNFMGNEVRKVEGRRG